MSDALRRLTRDRADGRCEYCQLPDSGGEEASDSRRRVDDESKKIRERFVWRYSVRCTRRFFAAVALEEPLAHVSKVVAECHKR